MKYKRGITAVGLVSAVMAGTLLMSASAAQSAPKDRACPANDRRLSQPAVLYALSAHVEADGSVVQTAKPITTLAAGTCVEPTGDTSVGDYEATGGDSYQKVTDPDGANGPGTRLKFTGVAVMRKADPVKADQPKTDPAKADQPKADPVKADQPKTDPAKTDQSETDKPMMGSLVAAGVVGSGRIGTDAWLW